MSYFRIHKRDINKKHGLTRNEQIEFSENKNSIFNNNWLEIKKKILAANLRYFSYLKHKKINEYHSELSLEILDNGNHIHHIWPKSYWNPEKENDWLNRNIYENLIILNQMEHLGKAHPKNKTKIIDKKCLNEILIAQYKKIRIFEKKHDPTYNIRKFYSLCCLIWKTKEELNVKNNDMNLEKIYLYIEDLIFL